MLKGKNTMRLNQATMASAVQLWVDSQFKDGKSPQVESVRSTNSGGFDVELKSDGEDGDDPSVQAEEARHG